MKEPQPIIQRYQDQAEPTKSSTHIQLYCPTKDIHFTVNTMKRKTSHIYIYIKGHLVDHKLCLSPP